MPDTFVDKSCPKNYYILRTDWHVWTLWRSRNKATIEGGERHMGIYTPDEPSYPPRTRYELDAYEQKREPDVRVSIMLVPHKFGWIRKQTLRGER